MDAKYSVACDEIIGIYKNLDMSGSTLLETIEISRLIISDDDSRKYQIEYDLAGSNGIQIAFKPKPNYLFTRIETVQFEEVENLKESEILELVTKYSDVHIDVTSYISDKIGLPEFDGRPEDDGYPKDLTISSLVAHWKGLRAYLTCEANLGGYDDRFEVILYVSLRQ